MKLGQYSIHTQLVVDLHFSEHLFPVDHGQRKIEVDPHEVFVDVDFSPLLDGAPLADIFQIPGIGFTR